MDYLLSIVVPTKNRYSYLEPLIQLVLSFQSEEIELVIEDNSDDNSVFLPIIEDNKSDRVKYYYTKESIPVKTNLDNAILHSNGEYVCVIGDDDGVLPSILECVRWMKRDNIDAIIPTIIAYCWPDHDENAKKNNGILSYQSIDFQPLGELVNPLEKLNDAIQNGFINRGELPIVYHGIVSRSSLNKVYNRGKEFSPGPSPDIAAGVALSLVINRFAIVKYPIIISGASQHHGAGAYRMKHGAAEIEQLPFLPEGTKENWEKRLPLIWSVETIWPESAIKALRYMGRTDLVDSVNYEIILFEFLLNRYCYYKEAYKVVKNKFLFTIKFIPFFIRRAFFAILRRMHFVKNEGDSSRIVINKVDNILKAADVIDSEYPATSFHLSNE